MPLEPESYLREVLNLAEKNLAYGELPIAATLILDGETIASASTSERKDRRFLIHAELKVLLKGDEMQLSFEERSRAALFTNLEPCLMCMGAAMSFFLGEIYYCLESPSDGAVDLVRNWVRQQDDFPGYQVPVIHGGYYRQECIRLFKQYIDTQPPGPMRDWAETLTHL